MESEAERLRVLACAGSGKTEVLARRVVRLLLSGAEPSSLIAFTFTEKAAAELKQRIEARAAEASAAFAELPPVARGMFVGTTHGWALQALQGLGGRYETLDGLTAESEWALLHRVARRLGIVDLFAEVEGTGSDRVATAPAIDVFLRSAEVVHNEGVDRVRLREAAPAFAAALERYEWLLGEMRLLPFRLMISDAARELDRGGALREALDGRVAHVLVDEYQDFNRSQDRLLGRLVELGATVTAVADDDQAIYQWRGGDVSLFVDFERRFPGTALSPLAENHRCRPEIVDFARHVVEALPAEKRQAKQLDPARAAAGSGAVELFAAADPKEEARLIAMRIETLLKDGHSAGDIAVLFRSVRTAAAPLVDELRRREIPVEVVGKTSLLLRPEMALVARIFVWWAGGTWYPNPEFEPETVTPAGLLDEIERVAGLDRAAAERALAAIEALGERVKEEGADDVVVVLDEILTALGLPRPEGRQEQGLGRMSELLTEFDHTVCRSMPSAAFEQLVDRGQEEADEDASLSTDPGSERPGLVLGATRGEIYLLRLRAFLAEFAGRAAEETPEGGAQGGDAVQVMTVHQSKGLEFPVVFVPSLVERRFPSALMGRQQLWYLPDELFDRQRYEGREEDEARLLYVALTRARELLVASWFERYENRRAQRSRFVDVSLRAALESCLQLGRGIPQVAPAGNSAELLDLDFSSLVTYSRCGYRYWLRHVCGFQPPRARELGFGKTLHHVIAELARRSAGAAPPTEERVDELLAESFYLPFAGPIPADNLRQSARRRTRAYVREFGAELVRTIEPERRFEVPLAGARMRGRIDLMLRAEDGAEDEVELIDFKTTSNRPPPEIHENQLRLYGSVAERLGKTPRRLAIHDLDADGGGRSEVAHDPAARTEFEGRLEEWVTGIATERFEPVDDASECAGCDFRSFCRHAQAAGPG